ncbi:MAG: hypothetical protein QXF82_04845 [Nitrososphaeria archaeon]
MASEIFKRKELVFALIAILGLWLFVDYSVVDPTVQSITSDVLKWATLLGGFMLIYGGLEALRYHTKVVYKKQSNWYWSAYFVVIVLVYVVSGLIQGSRGAIPQWLFNNMLDPASATMYSILAFYIISALYRTLRMRSIELTILSLVTILVVAANDPIITVYIPQLTAVRDWFISVPNVGANRGFLIGAAIGAIFLGVRVFLGREKSLVR